MMGFERVKLSEDLCSNFNQRALLGPVIVGYLLRELELVSGYSPCILRF